MRIWSMKKAAADTILLSQGCNCMLAISAEILRIIACLCMLRTVYATIVCVQFLKTMYRTIGSFALARTTLLVFDSTVDSKLILI